MTTWDYRSWLEGGAPEDEGETASGRPAPGKVSLTARLEPPVQLRASQSKAHLHGVAYLAEPVQRRASSTAGDQACRDAFDFDFSKPVQRAAAADGDANADAIHAAAARGLEAPATRLPHVDQIQKSFGRHNVSHVQAHVGGAAAEASTAMGAEAYAAGEHVAFARAPDIHTAAHEAAHVVQQKGGVQLKGGVGEAGDTYERHADAVADKVVAGESAEALLDQMAAGSSSPAPTSSRTVQQRKRGGQRDERKAVAASAVEVDDAFAFALDELDRGIKMRDYFAANLAMRDALTLLPRVDELLRAGPARSADEQTAIERLRVERGRFTSLAPRAPSGGEPSEDERAAWNARTPVSLTAVPEQSRPRRVTTSKSSIPRSTERAPITDVPVRPNDKTDRAHEEYLGRHWDQLRESARKRFSARAPDWKSDRLHWAPGVTADQRATKIVDSIFPTLHIAGQLERLVAPEPLGDALGLGAQMNVRAGEGDGDPSWNPSVGTAVARLLEDRLLKSMTSMGAKYVASYDRSGGHVDAANLPWQHPMDRVAAELLTQELVQVGGTSTQAGRPASARKPRKWRWLGKQDEHLWNWIEVTEPRDATAEDVILLLPPDVPPFVQQDGGLFQTPEDWARTQAGAAEFAPPSSTNATGTELASSRFAPKAAIAEVKGQPRVRWTREQFDHAVQEIRGHLNQIGSLLGQQYAERVAAATVIVGAAEVADKSLRADLANVFAHQEPLLREILEEMETFHAVSLARGRSRGRGPVEAVYLELALAAGNSHLYSVGRRHLKAARAKAAEVDKKLAAEALTSASAGAADLASLGGTGAQDARERQRDRFDALDSDAADPGAGHVDISIDAFVLHTQTLETRLDAMMDALFATRERLGPQLGSVFTMGLITSSEELGRSVGDVRDQAAAVRLWLLERVSSAANAGARQALLERAQEALGKRITSTQILALSRRVGKMLERVDDADRALQIVNMAIIAIEISLISAGVGAAVQAAVTTPGVAAATEAGVMTLGRVGAATAGVVAEATTATLLQVGLLNDKPGEALGENLLGAVFSIAAIRGFHKVTERFGPFTAENIDLWRKLGRADAKALQTMHVTLEMALGAGAGYVASELIRGPVQPTEDEALQMAMQGASIVASHWIIRRMHVSRTHLQEARAGLPPDVAVRLDATMKSIDALQAQAHEIAVKPVDAPVIVDMYAAHHRIIGAEAALVGTRDGAAGTSHASGPNDGRAPADGTAPPTADHDAAGPRREPIMLLGDDQRMRALARGVEPKPGYIDVVIHGDPSSFTVMRTDQDITVDQRVFASYLKRHGWTGQKVRLIACETGRHPQAIAAHLANKLQVEVLAPTDVAWIHGDGRITVGSKEKDTGEWKTFKPDQDARVPRPESDDLLELEKRRPSDPEPDYDRDWPTHVEPARHDARARASSTTEAELERALRARVVFDDTLVDGVEVHGRRRKGLLSFGFDAHVRVGRNAVLEDVLIHKRTIDDIERYNGVVGKLRELAERFKAFLRGETPDFAPGSQAWVTQQELGKLDLLLAARHAEFGTGRVDVHTLSEEITFLEGRRQYHEQVVTALRDEFLIGGPDTGKVTKQAQAAGYKLPGEDPSVALPDGTGDVKPDWYYYRHVKNNPSEFELVINRKVAPPSAPALRARLVGGKFAGFEMTAKQEAAQIPSDWSREQVVEHMRAHHGLEEFGTMLEIEGLASRAVLDAVIGKVHRSMQAKGKGVPTDALRHLVKDHFRPRIRERLLDPTLNDQQSWKRMREMLEPLTSSDRGNLAEEWYLGRHMPEAERHVGVGVTRSGGPNAGNIESRTIDGVDGGTAVEIKDVAGKIDIDQLNAYLDMLEGKLHQNATGSTPPSIKQLKYVFTKPEGAIANLQTFADALANTEYRGRLTIEVFDHDGVRHTITTPEKATELLAQLKVVKEAR